MASSFFFTFLILFVFSAVACRVLPLSLGETANVVQGGAVVVTLIGMVISAITWVWAGQ